MMQVSSLMRFDQYLVWIALIIVLIFQLLGRAQQLLRLKNREGKLQDEVRALNQRLLNIHSGNEVCTCIIFHNHNNCTL